MENLPKILKNNNVEPKSEAELKKKGMEIATGKVAGKWQIVYRRKSENVDIADLYNTVIKMAKKRALVDATITALAVGDMFTQDAEAVGEVEPEEEEGEGTAAGKEAGQEKGRSASEKRRATTNRRRSNG